MKANLFAVFFVLISILCQPASASNYPQAYPGGHPAQAVQPPASEPAALLKAGIHKLTRFIRSGEARDRAKALAFLKTEVAPYFDFAYMTRWAAGPAWRHMPAEQRASMQDQLTSAFMGTLVQKLTSYTNQPIRYFTPRGQSSNDVRVSAWIMQPNGYPTKLEFRFYRSANGWKIFDVKAAGNSAVLHYRNQFRHMYRQPGPAGFHSRQAARR